MSEDKSAEHSPSSADVHAKSSETSSDVGAKARAKRSTRPPAAKTAKNRASTPPSSARARSSKNPPAPSAPAASASLSAKAAPKKKSAKAAPRARNRASLPPSPVSITASVPPSSAPVSLHPSQTLVDHPEQKSAAASVRAAAHPGSSGHRKAEVARFEREDEISVPPASVDTGDLDEHDERFFAEGEAASQHGEQLAHAPKAIAGRASSDEHERLAVHVVPPERRAKMAKYVKYAVGLCGLLCGVAIVRVAVSRSHPVVAEAAAAQVAPPPPVLVAEPPSAVDPEPAPAPAPVATEVPPPGKSAKEELESARALLEHGKTKDAIEGATRSVGLDPTDAEAWLILGAAQLNAGHPKEAREAFVECTKQAKSGPVVECKNMLR